MDRRPVSNDRFLTRSGVPDIGRNNRFRFNVFQFKIRFTRRAPMTFIYTDDLCQCFKQCFCFSTKHIGLRSRTFKSYAGTQSTRVLVECAQNLQRKTRNGRGGGGAVPWRGKF